jgi:hypothetical protein
MPWNSTYPLGSVSVSANRTIGQQNTNYTEVTLGNSIIGTNNNTTRDHFWNVGTNEDGRHRFINSPAFTVGLVPADPVVGAGMDAVLYLKITNGRPEWFHRNNIVGSSIYQATPSYLTGTVSITSAAVFSNITTIPANVYGEIYIYKITNNATAKNSLANIQYGTFLSNNNTVHAFSSRIKIEDTSNDYLLELANKETTDLNIRVRLNAGPSGTWNYRITYRAL